MTFIEAVQKNANRVNRYELGKSGDNGACDCIGLIIGALEMMGIPWKGTHGTNYTVRNALISVSVIDNINALEVGELVFKRRNKGDNGYSLPSKYSGDPDQTDYYHVGVVMSVNPLRIIHCTGVPTGIATDTKQGKWSVHGQLAVLANIEPEEGEKIMYKVHLHGGNLEKPINFRKGMSTTSAMLGEIPQDAEVDYLGESGDWAKVIYGGRTGYVLSAFVVKADVPVVTDEVPFWFTEKLMEIDEHEQAIRSALDEIYERIGRG